MNNGLNQYEYYFETLRENSWFSELQNDAIKSLLEISIPQIWPTKTCILDPDLTLHRFYILISGKIKEYNYDEKHNRELIHRILAKNDFFNVCTLMNGKTSNLYYEVLSTAELIYIGMDNMRLWIKENPQIVGPILNFLVAKTEKLEDKVFDLCSLDISTRLAKLFLDHLNKKTQKMERINGLSHYNLAGLIGTTRAVLNRHLQEFKDVGILRIEGGNIVITDVPLLIHRFHSQSNKIPLD